MTTAQDKVTAVSPNSGAVLKYNSNRDTYVLETVKLVIVSGHFLLDKKVPTFEMIKNATFAITI